MESKSAAVIRKHIGYGYIAASHATAMMTFYREHLNPYLNFHRPCAVPEILTDRRVKQRRVYRRYATPWEPLQRALQFIGYLKPGVKATEMERQALRLSDWQAARRMQEAKRILFAGFPLFSARRIQMDRNSKPKTRRPTFRRLHQASRSREEMANAVAGLRTALIENSLKRK